MTSNRTWDGRFHWCDDCQLGIGHRWWNDPQTYSNKINVWKWDINYILQKIQWYKRDMPFATLHDYAMYTGWLRVKKRYNQLRGTNY